MTRCQLIYQSKVRLKTKIIFSYLFSTLATLLYAMTIPVRLKTKPTTIRRDGKAAKRFFKRLLRRHKGEPRTIVTDKLGSYRVARRELIPDTIYDTSQYANNRAELSHEPTRVRERGMRKFKSMHQAQRFLGAHAAVNNLFNLGRHLASAENYRYFRLRAFAAWEKVVSV